MKILARANKKLRGNGKFYAIPEPTKSWFYVTEYDSNGYPIKAKTIGCSGAMPYSYMYGSNGSSYSNVVPRFLREFEINDGVTSISMNAFYRCSSLSIITMPSGITSIESAAFGYCSNCLLFDFRKATQIPTLANVNAFNNTSSSKKIVVPDSLYDSWITATNWSSTTNNIVSSIIKASDYEASL